MRSPARDAWTGRDPQPSARAAFALAPVVAGYLLMVALVLSSAALTGFVARRNGRRFGRWFLFGVVAWLPIGGCFIAMLDWLGKAPDPIALGVLSLLALSFAPVVALTAGPASARITPADEP